MVLQLCGVRWSPPLCLTSDTQEIFIMNPCPRTIHTRLFYIVTVLYILSITILGQRPKKAVMTTALHRAPVSFDDRPVAWDLC
jgi:hypothetical protein